MDDDDDDDDLDKRRQVLEVFRDTFQSDRAQKQHQAYINRLHERLNQWKSQTNEKIKQFIDDKKEEIDQLYDQYCEEFNDKYSDIKQQIQDNDTSSDINDQIEHFNTYCQSNTIENCIRLNTAPFSNDQLADNIQLEYVVRSDPSSSSPRRNIEPLESPPHDRLSQSTESVPKKSPVEPVNSFIEERRSEPLESPAEQRRIESLHSGIKKMTDEPLDSPIEERRSEPVESPAEQKRIEPLHYSGIKKMTDEPLDSPIEEGRIDTPVSVIRKKTDESPVEDQDITPTRSFIRRRPVELFDSPVVERTVKSSEPIIRKRLLQSPTEEKPLQSPVEERTIERIESYIEKSSVESPIEQRMIEPSESIVRIKPTEAIKLIVRERTESISSARTSSRGSPFPTQDYPRQLPQIDKSQVKRQSDPSKEEPVIYHPRSSARRTSDDERKSLTRLYVGKRDVLTPVLVGKDRDVYNQTEKITEYSIDSIPIPVDGRGQSFDSNTDSDNEMKIVRAYKVLIREENDYQPFSASSSDRELDEDDDDDEELSNINRKFNLKKFDQINYSTIMFRKCETEYNCLSSSTERNELLLYNSKLKVLIILQHEDHQQCRHRFYLHWPKTLSSNISDITYCQANDHFLISTRDTSRIYLFDRQLLSIIDLGQLSNDSPIRRIHCYEQTIYCLVSNNYLLEYQIDEAYSQLHIIRKIKLFDSVNQSQDTCYHLLDVTCDDNYLIILYANEHDEIRLQSIYRQTRKFHQDILIDIRQPINQSYIRIESTYLNGHFLYLNGSQQHLKAIDLVNYNKGKITSVMRRHTKPTNICFLRDGRLVILYEEPYFLSVHDFNNRPVDN